MLKVSRRVKWFCYTLLVTFLVWKLRNGLVQRTRKELNVPKNILEAVGADEWICKTIRDPQKTCPASSKTSIAIRNGTSKTGCNIPDLDPFHPSILRLLSKVQKPDCSKQKSYGKLVDGKISFTDPDVVKATYRRIVRSGDFNFVLGTPTPVESTKKITDEFFEVEFLLKNGQKMKGTYIQPVPHEHLLKPNRTKTPGIPLNILIIGVDSLSHSNTQRSLPKVYELLKKKFGSFIFKGHSIVGDGTTEQLAAMLTGLGELEQYESRRHHKNPKPVDGWAWIYKQLKENGYLTGYSADRPSLGVFQFRLLGFKTPPTDFYARPFFQAWEKYGKTGGRNMCLGSRTISKVQFDYIREVFQMFPEQLKFFFSFNVAYSHNSNSEAGMIEPDLLSLLEDFRDKGYLNNTLLIVMGDHGNRYSKARALIQGKLEERLPLLSMTFPPWFLARYPKVTNNLRRNTDRLTSWYDVYATFRHMLSYPEPPLNLKHGRSLLQEIPLSRTCTDATIEPHWCPCLRMTPISVSHTHVKNAALAAVEYMNVVLKQHEASAEHCQILSLHDINYALIEQADEKVLSFKQTNDLKPEFSQKSVPAHENYCRYQLQITTLPNNGIYEATVRYHSGWFFVSKSISRVNKYGDQPDCIAGDLPHLRKFCICN